MTQLPTAIDLFCGAGGMALGFKQAGFNVLAAYDLEAFNTATYQRNFPETNVIKADLARVRSEEIADVLGKRSTALDVIFGGPPCQGFSIGGNRRHWDDRNLLIFEFSRIVRDLRPRYFVLENVKGLLSHYSQPVLDSFVRRVKRNGYRIVEPIQVLNAADFGVPQRRNRTFLLGYRRDLAPCAYPDKQLGDRTRVRDAIADLQVIDEHDYLYDHDELRQRLEPAQSEYARILRGDADDFASCLPRRRVKGKLTGCLKTRHAPDVIDRFAATRPGAADSVSRYIRLSWDDVCPTLRAGTGRERGSHTAPRPIHPTATRCITAREAARLHSLPDWFVLHGTRWHDFRQIGNSVPPLLARAVATRMLSAL